MLQTTFEILMNHWDVSSGRRRRYLSESKFMFSADSQAKFMKLILDEVATTWCHELSSASILFAFNRSSLIINCHPRVSKHRLRFQVEFFYIITDDWVDKIVEWLWLCSLTSQRTRNEKHNFNDVGEFRWKALRSHSVSLLWKHLFHCCSRN